ncbi:hypothetical protein D5085_04105 [Ectothiorhodospiraceae bacterium BW-2]|nr:hypothetical protein D5085_04105 [Ectothiorhodospiraceae bacterium BW-2]
MTTQAKPHYRIPYGVADYIKLRQGGEFYLDKTHYLPKLEEAGRFLFLIRPRRMGKSLLQSMMECYYDLKRAEQWEALFSDTWIYANPTDEKHRYMVLRFDFSRVSGRSVAALEAAFDNYCRRQIQVFIAHYQAQLPDSISDDLLNQPSIQAVIGRLMDVIAEQGLPPLYLFIDEYDNFANTLLASEGREAYQQLTHGRGFLRDFFAELKGASGATGGALSRLFITGVSPVTLDDVTSGFNIGANISLDHDFNAMLGFNERELEQLFSVFGQSYSAHREVMNLWYNHYRFSRQVEETITNSDMALYYLKSLHRLNQPPDELIDQNIRTDYGKLRHLIQLDRKLNGSFERLHQIINQGGIASSVKSSFPAELLANTDNFISLLYYFGLLTFSTETERGEPKLVIPNQTVKQLIYSYIREAVDDVGLFRPDIFTIGEKLKAFAWDGEWQPFFSHLTEQLQKYSGMRDYLHGEKMIQGFLLAWLNLNPWFYALSEQELGGGFVDLYLSPFYAKYPEMAHAWLIELKYLKRDNDTADARAKLITEATTQLNRYRNDSRVLERAGHARIHALVLIWSGWELVQTEEIGV